MATKTAVNNENAPNFTSMFNWGLKLTNFSELFLLAGHGAGAGHCLVLFHRLPRHPGSELPVRSIDALLLK